MRNNLRQIQLQLELVTDKRWEEQGVNRLRGAFKNPPDDYGSNSR